MAKTKMFTNRNVLQQAAEKLNWKIQIALEISAEIPALTGIDTRHLNDLGPLLIDLSNVPEEERESYYKAELRKMSKALYTFMPDTGKPDPEAVKPYITAMFNAAVTNVDNINWNDVAQVEKLLATMKAVQALATVGNDFKEALFDLYPTHAGVARIDAIAGKAYLAYLKTVIEMSKLDIDLHEKTYFPTTHFDSISQEVLVDVVSAVYDATVSGTDIVTIDPTKSELMTKHFLEKPFVALHLGGTSEYDQDEYLTDFAHMLSTTYYNSAIESMVVSKVTNSDQGFGLHDLLYINGKSLNDITKELEKCGMTDREARLEAAKMLRGCLTDGESVVTLMRASFTKEGEISFYHQDIRVDLDKLNEADRQQNYSWFRRMLHGMHLWRIPEKYPTNEARDERVAINKASEEHNNALKAAEDRVVNIYNNLVPTSDRREILNMIPTLAKKDPLAEKSVANDSPAREPIAGIVLNDGANKVPTEQKNEEKVLDKEPLAK